MSRTGAAFGATVDSVKHPVVPIQALNLRAALGGNGCDACHQGSLGPDCKFTLGPRSGPPTLNGPEDDVKAVLDALARALGSGQLDGTHWVQSVTVREGEVEVMLTADTRCAGAELADTAFQTLKRLFADTDIYVMLAGA
ncbi:MAG: hypothetical protein IPP87_25635 [Ideonella sp.]|nr:hypothetical protein [Ideonella sp.]